MGELPIEQQGGSRHPALCSNQGKASCRELAGRLRDDVIVGRGTAALESGQEPLMPPDLGHRQGVALEQFRS